MQGVVRQGRRLSVCAPPRWGDSANSPLARAFHVCHPPPPTEALTPPASSDASCVQQPTTIMQATVLLEELRSCVPNALAAPAHRRRRETRATDAKPSRATPSGWSTTTAACRARKCQAGLPLARQWATIGGLGRWVLGWPRPPKRGSFSPLASACSAAGTPTRRASSKQEEFRSRLCLPGAAAPLF